MLASVFRQFPMARLDTTALGTGYAAYLCIYTALITPHANTEFQARERMHSRESDFHGVCISWRNKVAINISAGVISVTR